MAATAHQQRGNASPPRGTLFVAWWAVAVLLLFYIVSTIDRSIINMMVQPLERDLHVTDFQIGLLQGPAFGLFYVLCGLPMGWLVDRFPRRWICAIGIVAWGAATAYCGGAGNLVQLALGRMGVGLGESVLTPAAHSIIAEQFPPRRLATAISVYTLGSVIGGGIALALGGLVVHQVTHMPPVDLPMIGAIRAWQLAFLLVGVVTLALTPLIFSVREHRNLATAGATANQSPPRAGEGLAFILGHWRLAIGLPVAFGVTNILCQAYFAWIPTFMIRGFGWNAAQAGLAFGVVMLFGGAAGQMLGAVSVDWLYGRGVRNAHVLYHGVGLAVSAPCAIGAFLCGSPTLFLGLIAVFFTLTYPFVGYAAAAVQLFTPTRARGQSSAVFLALITIVGMAFGPTIPAWLNEHVFDHRLGMSLAVVTAGVAPLSVLMMAWVGRAMKAMVPVGAA